MDFFGGVNDLDDDREVGGQAEDFGGMEVAGMAEAHGAAEDGGSGEVGFAGFEDDGFEEGLVVVSVRFSEVDAEALGGLGSVHVSG
ncbi:MAG: hypothetical protein RI897_797 [Verrucomicrobiota bacterium]